MKQRSTYLLLALLLALTAISYLLLRSPGEREASYSLADLKLSVDSSQVQSIRIVRPSSVLSLQDIGGTWFVVKDEPSSWRYPADENSMKQLLGNVQNFKVKSLISSNPSKQNLFQVDSTGTQLVLTDRVGKKTEFVVGKMGPSFSETYVRPSNSNNVYLAEGISPWELNKELRDWRDKTILKLTPDSVRAISYRYAKDLFSITRDSLWRIRKDTVVTSVITGVLNSLTNLRADDFVDSTAKVSTPQLKLDIALPQPITLNFSPLPPDSSRYWVTTSAAPQIFIMNKWSVQNILKQRKDYLPSKK